MFTPVILGKWDFEAHEYVKHDVPENMTIVLYSTNMDLPINCSNCFKNMTFGDGYTSRTIHNPTGFGFPVCEDCYEEEVAQEKNNKEIENANQEIN